LQRREKRERKMAGILKEQKKEPNTKETKKRSLVRALEKNTFIIPPGGGKSAPREKRGNR